MSRVRLNRVASSFSDEDVIFFSTGAAVLDCVLGGGYGADRVINIVGDRSTGKTLLAIEAGVNFLRRFKLGRVRYVDGENAFDESYASVIGWPSKEKGRKKRVEVDDEIETVEEFYNDLEKFCDDHESIPTLYILDSLDSLSSEAELAREFGKPAYDSKPRQMSELFRRLRRKVKQSGTTLMIISQTRQRITSTFTFGGKSYSRSGGTALDFYASQVLYLRERTYERKHLRRKVGKVERSVGIAIEAFCDKNKVGLPHRRCTFPLLFNYGIDDVGANLRWLDEIGRLKKVVNTDKPHVAKRRIGKLPDSEWHEERQRLASAVRDAWDELESSFMPSRGKYDG